jgi:hypothetical protein
MAFITVTRPDGTQIALNTADILSVVDAHPKTVLWPVLQAPGHGSLRKDRRGNPYLTGCWHEHPQGRRAP